METTLDRIINYLLNLQIHHLCLLYIAITRPVFLIWFDFIETPSFHTNSIKRVLDSLGFISLSRHFPTDISLNRIALKSERIYMKQPTLMSWHIKVLKITYWGSFLLFPFTSMTTLLLLYHLLLGYFARFFILCLPLNSWLPNVPHLFTFSHKLASHIFSGHLIYYIGL